MLFFAKAPHFWDGSPLHLTLHLSSLAGGYEGPPNRSPHVQRLHNGRNIQVVSGMLIISTVTFQRLPPNGYLPTEGCKKKRPWTPAMNTGVHYIAYSKYSWKAIGLKLWFGDFATATVVLCALTPPVFDQNANFEWKLLTQPGMLLKKRNKI